MAKVRRFQVDSLEGKEPGSIVSLPENEAAHVRVLRLVTGAEVELFDASGRSSKGTLVESGIRIHSVEAPRASNTRLMLATAWPKGKRAATMIEKCTELGLDVLIPVHYSRSVVTKDEEAEGLQRLRRISAEAAKQCGRNEPLQIAPEQSFEELLAQAAPDTMRLLLDPRATESIAEVLAAQRDVLKMKELLLCVGPEGGFSKEELNIAKRFQLRSVRLARHVLRVETAAIAACAITRAQLDL
jgi:16S rRNA (uracil1498-N3)-methyltransferase